MEAMSKYADTLSLEIAVGLEVPYIIIVYGFFRIKALNSVPKGCKSKISLQIFLCPQWQL